MSATIPLESTHIDALIVANHVEAMNGLLYLSGGGWTDLHRRIKDGNAPINHFGIGMSVRVPWIETNQKRRFIVEVQAEDSRQVIVHAEGEISVGRPPQLTRGSVQHVVVAVTIDVTFPKAGGYQVVASIDGKDTATWPFRVHDTYE